MLPDGLPKLTLGWGILNWCSTWLVNPDSKWKLKGDQWIFQDDQALFILWFYAVDEDGEWLFRRAYRERAKGTGKSPMVAAIACAEFLGPTLFSHFDPKTGQAIGRRNPDPVIWLAGCALDASNHTYNYIMGLLEGKCERAYNLDIQLSQIRIRGYRANAILKQITSSPKSHEGPQPTFVICEETQNWTPAEQGEQLTEAIHRGLSKSNGRRIEVTNAPKPGDNSEAEKTKRYYQDISEGNARDDGLLYDTYTIEVQDIYDKAQAMPALQEMYRNAPWINLERLYRDICDPSHSENSSRRFYFNQTIAPREQWITEKHWQMAQRNMRLRKTDLISLGFRTKKNCCAIVATRLEDSAVFLLELWERPDNANRDWEVPYGEIDRTMRKIFGKYNVFNIVVSPENMHDFCVKWLVDYEGEIEVEELWLSRSRQKVTDAVSLFETAVNDQRLIHDGNEDLERHVMQTFLDEQSHYRLLRMATEHSKSYIVAAEAAVLSFWAAQLALKDGALRDGPEGTLYMF